jgi:CRP/FNR family cyclic AMP-dependent transcriptional regulator
MASVLLDHLVDLLVTGMMSVLGATLAWTWSSVRARARARPGPPAGRSTYDCRALLASAGRLCAAAVRGRRSRDADGGPPPAPPAAPGAREVGMGTTPAGSATPPRRALPVAAASWHAGSLLGRLCPDDRDALGGLGARVRFDRGKAIVREGAAGDHVYLLLAGSVKITGNEAGREPLLGVRLAGDTVGEMAMLSGAPRSATVVAASTTVARVISALELRGLLAHRAGVAIELAGVLSQRLRWANQRRVDFVALTAPARVASLLLALDESYGRHAAGSGTILPLTQAEIASLAGVGLPTAEKALRNLQRTGVVELGYRRLVITDAAALRGIMAEDGPAPA